jgi:CRISPR-associated protein Csd2
MSVIQNKIDFAVVLSVKHANPNGDPLNGNRPRTDYNGYGEITDVCLKRKIRDRLQDAGLDIFVQSDDRKKDDATSLRDRAEKALGKKFNPAETVKLACAKWVDVRAFGQLFALPKKVKPKLPKEGKPKGDEDEGDKGVSIPIRGPVTLQSAFSLQPARRLRRRVWPQIHPRGWISADLVETSSSTSSLYTLPRNRAGPKHSEWRMRKAPGDA